MALANENGGPKLVPPMTPIQITEDIAYVQPLSRRGIGPGIVILTPNQSATDSIDIQDCIPSVRMKWAEESYCVIQVQPAAWKDSKLSPLDRAIEFLASRNECQPHGKLGLVCYDASQWEAACAALQQHAGRFAGAALYADTASFPALASHAIAIPTIFHLAGSGHEKAARPADCVVHEYAAQRSGRFAVPFGPDFHYASEAVAHSRTLAFLKPRMGAPHFDLEAIWDEHTYYEFDARSVENTMATMVQEPYVNNIPTMTGGIGREKLTAFYRDHFIFANPADAEIELISRTVGIDRVVDEFVFKFTFDSPIGWLFPGVPPTHKHIEIPMMALVNFRGDRLYHEHIHWDSASALRQIGALPTTVQLTVPTATATATTNGAATDGQVSGDHKVVELRLPVAEGTEAAQKMRDKNAVESNQMLTFQAQDVHD